MYDLSSKYYLKALSLNPTANHVWSYLRISLDCMQVTFSHTSFSLFCFFFFPKEFIFFSFVFHMFLFTAA